MLLYGIRTTSSAPPYGHSGSLNLYELLRRAEPSKIKGRTLRMLQAIEKECRKCRLTQQNPRRLKYTIKDDMRFNHTLYPDVCKVEGVNVLYVVHAATRYQSAQCLINETAGAIWNEFRHCWLDSYLGPPDAVKNDTRTNFN